MPSVLIEIDDFTKFSEAIRLGIVEHVFTDSQGSVLISMAEKELEKSHSFEFNSLLRLAIEKYQDDFENYNTLMISESEFPATKGVMLFFGVGIACGFMIGMMAK